MATVSEIFDKAERFFEVRVSQLLNEKRMKAEENGTVLNARKAKRDARTAAGREKLDALVRRLADLALIQERIIREHCPDQSIVKGALEQHTKRLWFASFGSFPPPHLIFPGIPASFPPPFLHPPVFAPLPPPLPLQLPPPPPPPPGLSQLSPHQPPATVVIRNTAPAPFAASFISSPQFNRPLNPDADPWEAKPASPAPKLPPPLTFNSEWDSEIKNDEENIEDENVKENQDKNKNDHQENSSMFASTESVLHHLGPDFKDEFSPCSILDIADPIVVNCKQPFRHD